MRSGYEPPPPMPVICPNVPEVMFPCGLANTAWFRTFAAWTLSSSRFVPPTGKVRNAEKSRLYPPGP